MTTVPTQHEPTKVIAFLRDIPLFSPLNIHILGHICTFLEPFQIAEGKVLVREGEEIRHLYLVMDGRLEVRQGNPKSSGVVLGEITHGEVVGEWNAQAGTVHQNTVVSLSESAGFTLEIGRFQEILKDHPETMGELKQLPQSAGYRPPRNLVCDWLAGIDLFSSLNRKTIEDLEPYFAWRRMKKGDVLIRQGEPGSSLYVIISGRLRYEVRDEDYRIVREGLISTGEVVGESSVLTQEPRSATVFAVRNCELLTLPPFALNRLVMRYPLVLLEVTRILARRLKAGSSRQKTRGKEAVSLIPLSRGIDVRAFAEGLSAALREFGRSDLVNPRSVNTAELSRTIDRSLDADIIPVISGIDGDAGWNAACAQHADRILYLVSPGDPVDEGILEMADSLPGDVLYLNSSGKGHIDSVPPAIRHLADGRVHHVRTGSRTDIRRIARFLCGRSVGLTLGGGGARGLAHIGVVRALREAGIPIDLVAGTSIGALVGAAVASDASVKEMTEAAWEYLVAGRPFRDPAIPLVSLLRGRKITAGIRKYFGERNIEDLPLRYSAVSTDLTNRCIHLMDQGPIWKAVRSSVAIPGLIPPVFDSGRLLADGGLLNNAPVDVAVGMGADTTILVDVSGHHQQKADIMAPIYKGLPTGWSPGFGRYLKTRFHPDRTWTGIGEVIMTSLLLGSFRSTKENASTADFYLKLPVADFSMLDFKSMQNLIEIGYREAIEKVEAWKSM